MNKYVKVILLGAVLAALIGCFIFFVGGYAFNHLQKQIAEEMAKVGGVAGGEGEGGDQWEELFTHELNTKYGTWIVYADSISEAQAQNLGLGTGEATIYRIANDQNLIGALAVDGVDSDFSELELVQHIKSAAGGFEEAFVLQLKGESEPSSCGGRGGLRVVGISSSTGATVVPVDVCSPDAPTISVKGATIVIETKAWHNDVTGKQFLASSKTIADGAVK